MKKLVKIGSAAICFLLAGVMLVACGGANVIETNAYKFDLSGYDRNATQTANYQCTSAEWDTLVADTGLVELKFDYKFGNLAVGEKYARMIKIEAPDNAGQINLFALDQYTVGEGEAATPMTSLWDIANNIVALNEADGVGLSQKLYNLAKDRYVGYWNAKAGNTYATSSSKNGTFYFCAEKAGTYKITVDIVRYEAQGSTATALTVLGSTTKTIKVKSAANS